MVVCGEPPACGVLQDRGGVAGRADHDDPVFCRGVFPPALAGEAGPENFPEREAGQDRLAVDRRGASPRAAHGLHHVLHASYSRAVVPVLDLEFLGAGQLPAIGLLVPGHFTFVFHPIRRGLAVQSGAALLHPTRFPVRPGCCSAHFGRS